MSNIKLHRVIRANPKTIYESFLNSESLSKWLPPNGYTAKIHQLEPEVGKTFKISFIEISTGNIHSFGGTYIELVPYSLISYTDKFEDPNLDGEMKVIIKLKELSCGTNLDIIQEGIPEQIPAELCYLGWQESLNLLSLLVERK